MSQGRKRIGKLSISEISRRPFDEWFPVISPLLEKQVSFHASLENAFSFEFDEENYDALEDYREMSESRDFACFAAIDEEGQAVGFVSASVYVHDDELRDNAHIIDLYVDEAYRHEGIASKLVAAALKWIEVGYPRVESVAVTYWDGNDGMDGFYRKCGFSPKCHVMGKRLR